MRRELERYGMWIDGVAVTNGRPERETLDPATGRPWALTTSTSVEDLDDAVASATAAYADEAWAGLSATQRGELLLRLAELIRRDSEQLAALESRDNGKPIWQTRSEVASVPAWYAYFGGAADKLTGANVEVSRTRAGATSHRALGVVAILSPFNGPIPLTSYKLAPALAAGNTVVIKPSPDTPITAFELGRLASEAGFPPGVVNVVPGDAGVGASLVEHPDVAAVAFTGSSVTGRRIAASAAKTLKRVLIEAGGKSPYIVFEDAQLESAVISAVAGIFGGTGQSCVAGSRMLVHRKVYDDFVDRMSRRARALRVGDPRDERTHIGPLASARQLERVEGYVDLARKDGLEIVQGSEPDDPQLADGCFHAPTLIAGAQNSMRICQEEIFGPVGVVLPFDDEEEAIAIANDSPYGLAAGVWTDDARRAQRVARRIEAGTVWVNCYRAFHWTLPFGGFKQSGYGRDNGMEALREYTQVQTIVNDWGAPPDDLFVD
jgi:(Z)-2-((N-methylformamido)methylene)-5-hydroxybutyrolactone dehydrogenase